jgi:hypothetical protein
MRVGYIYVGRIDRHISSYVTSFLLFAASANIKQHQQQQQQRARYNILSSNSITDIIYKSDVVL